MEEDLEGESSEESDLADHDSEPEDEYPSGAKRRRRVSSLWEEEVGEMVAPPWSPPSTMSASPTIASPSVTTVHPLTTSVSKSKRKSIIEQVGTFGND